MTDFGFKRIFGSDPNRDLSIAFLNEVFRGRKHIIDLVYNKNEHTGETTYEGGAIFDLLCTGNAIFYDDSSDIITCLQRPQWIKRIYHETKVH